MTDVKYQQRTPDSTGGTRSIIDVKCDQCDFRLGGILSSGMARIGITGFAEAGGTVGTPKFKSILRPFAAASMLPQSRVAHEHVQSTSLSGARAGRLVAICFYVIERMFVLTAIVAQATLRVYRRKPFHAIVCFRLSSK